MASLTNSTDIHCIDFTAQAFKLQHREFLIKTIF